MSEGSSHQAYVEDYDSVISEVVPLTRRTTAREKSGLSNSQSADSNFDVSDSGYSSHANTPNNETPPLKSRTPAPLPPINTRQESLRRSKTPGIGRPASKSFSRTQSPAVPRNIPNARPRERSGTVESNTTTEDCECSDCKKGSKPSPSSSSPSILSNGAWPLHASYHGGSYGQSPSWGGHAYPVAPARYDPYESGAMDAPRESGSKKQRSSMPPPPRPQSTFSGATASSYSGFGGSYFGQAPSPAPQPPTPVSTCPPTYSAYAPPPPPMDHAPSPVHTSPYGPPSSIPSYGQSYGYDAWGYGSTPITPSSSYPAPVDYTSMPPPPQINRRNSMRAQANAGAAIHDLPTEEYQYQQPPRPQRRPSRVSSGERPSWPAAQYSENLGHSRSYSVPPVESASMSERRKMTTPGPPRRRESGHTSSRPEVHPSRLGPSALSRAMESCAIDDDCHPPTRSQSRSHYDSHHHSNQLSRRDPGTMMHATHSDSGSSGSGRSHDKEELVSMTVPDAEGEAFTMRYPAGIPVKLQVNAYRYVQQRQQQVHAQLQYGAMEHGGRRTSGEYTYRQAGGYNRRATLNGV
ncbi:hypothetical protein EDC01DRAFT_669912 [Geopyxis carbonaria]|nr:hypothetical protein EDC01DRAFT_669912 [Geopyxis carbonaria]